MSAAEGVEASWWMSLSEMDPASVISSSTKCSSDLLLSSFRKVSFNRVASLKPAAAYPLSETYYRACTVLGQCTRALPSRSGRKYLIFTRRGTCLQPRVRRQGCLRRSCFKCETKSCTLWMHKQHICYSWNTKRLEALVEDFAHRQEISCMLSVLRQHTCCKSFRGSCQRCSLSLG